MESGGGDGVDDGAWMMTERKWTMMVMTVSGDGVSGDEVKWAVSSE